MNLETKSPLDKEQVIRLAVIAGIGIVLLIILLVMAPKKKNANILNVTPISILPAGSPPVSRQGVERKSQEGLLKQPWGRDPFSDANLGAVEKVSESETVENFVLSGILFKEGKKVAILNRYFVREGDDIFGVKVERIEKDRVILKRGEDEITVRMGTQ